MSDQNDGSQGQLFSDAAVGAPAYDEVEKFREFLDQISPEDFGAGSGSGGPT